MAHEVEQMFYVGEVPWHKLGHRFIEPPTLQEGLVAAGLDWQVTTEPLFTGAKEKVDAQITRRSSDNSILGVVGSGYHPLQNTEAFKFFEPFLESKNAALECAGSLRDGKRVFVLARIKSDPLTVKGNDIVNKYILLSNAHDGTMAVRAGFTPIRVVCANTLAMAHQEGVSTMLSIKHTKSVAENLELVQKAMNLANQSFEATAEQYRLLASREIDGKDLEKFVKLVFNTPKKIQEAGGDLNQIDNKRILNSVTAMFEKGRGNDMKEIRGTLWAAYNAVNEYLQYERGDDDQVRLDNMWFGQSAALNRKALQAATLMAG